MLRFRLKPNGDTVVVVGSLYNILDFPFGLFVKTDTLRPNVHPTPTQTSSACGEPTDARSLALMRLRL